MQRAPHRRKRVPASYDRFPFFVLSATKLGYAGHPSSQGNFLFSCKRFAKFCEEMKEKLARPRY